jgi:hypothetical protein
MAMEWEDSVTGFYRGESWLVSILDDHQRHTVPTTTRSKSTSAHCSRRRCQLVLFSSIRDSCTNWLRCLERKWRSNLFKRVPSSRVFSSIYSLLTVQQWCNKPGMPFVMAWNQSFALSYWRFKHTKLWSYSALVGTTAPSSRKR